jgi:radical SAM protein with 4Fe4S-binding SPASM domain
MGFTIGIEVTKRCNFTCRHCFVDAGQPRGHELTLAELRTLLTDLRACGADSVGWSGGEPLLRPDLVELTALARSLGLTPSLVSNGFLATPQKLAALCDAGLAVIQISLDGPTPELAHRFRQGPKAAFDRALDAIKASVDLGLRTHLCALLTPETAAEVVDMAELAHDLRVAGLRYTMWAPSGRAAHETYDEAAWGGQALADFFAAVAKLRRAGLNILIDCPTGPHPGRAQFRCSADHRTCYITADGDLYPCTALLYDAYRVGNVLRTPVRDLLFGADVTLIQRQLASNLPAGTCTGCTLLERCRGACPGRSIAAFGSFEAACQHGSPACLCRLHGGEPHPLDDTAED